MTGDRANQLIVLDEALNKLAAESPEKAELVKLRYFAGLSHQEAAQAWGFPVLPRIGTGLTPGFSCTVKWRMTGRVKKIAEFLKHNTAETRH